MNQPAKQNVEPGIETSVWPFVLPFLIFMLVSSFSPSIPTDATVTELLGKQTLTAAEQYAVTESRELAQRYFLFYGCNVLLVTGTMLFFWRTYFRHFPFSVSKLAIPTGVLGIFVWVGICSLGIEPAVAGLFSDNSTSLRSHFDPFAGFDEQWQTSFFLAVRFFGLVIMVPICEELLLRGFLMRYVESTDWWNVNLARLGFRTMLVAPLYGLATHPQEALAAIAWFSLVTWLVHRTGKFWDAVLAHAATNLLLGLYVCLWEQWYLW